MTDADLTELLGYLEDLMEDLREIDDPVRTQVFNLLNGIDALHRMGLSHLEDAFEARGLHADELRGDHPAIAWLFDAYAVGVDQHAVADRALDDIRPYIHSHGGEVELLDVDEGVVHVKLSGACEGCTASDVTLEKGVEDALREHFPGFDSLEVEEDPEHVESHPPPGETLLEIQSGPPGGFDDTSDGRGGNT